ncbi:hypothetical protein SEA_TAYLORSIPHT_48 [Arthrobacter phage TaylorSipht]|nr:hypothetical protein SEA_TAYLORSIPHT_48 [Arthrobacter phage TaylorSipht]
MSAWSVNKNEGFAAGPSEELTDNGVTVKLQAIWTDEAGVCVSIDTADEPVPASLAVQVCEAVKRLAALAAPALAAVAVVAGRFADAAPGFSAI